MPPVELDCAESAYPCFVREALIVRVGVAADVIVKLAVAVTAAKLFVAACEAWTTTVPAP